MIRGRGVKVNGIALPCKKSKRVKNKLVKKKLIKKETKDPIVCYADQSLKLDPNYADLQAQFELRFIGGAVINALHVLTHSNCCYLKPPKVTQGGGAIWDFAVVALLLEEHSGNALHYDGTPINLNRPDSVYFNDVGIAFLSADLNPDEFISLLP